MWGKSGAIRLHINSRLNINGTNIRLKGDMDTRGETGTAGVVGALVVLPVAGFFVTGTSAEMPLNMPGRAFLDQHIGACVTAPAATAPAEAVASPRATSKIDSLNRGEGGGLGRPFSFAPSRASPPPDANGH